MKKTQTMRYHMILIGQQRAHRDRLWSHHTLLLIVSPLLSLSPKLFLYFELHFIQKVIDENGVNVSCDKTYPNISFSRTLTASAHAYARTQAHLRILSHASGVFSIRTSYARAKYVSVELD